MISERFYLSCYNSKNQICKLIVKHHNKTLIRRYPFLLPRNCWSDKVVSDYDYSYTELDSMPEGWRIAFGIQMCEDIKQSLLDTWHLEEFRILDIKEKYGALRVYTGPATEAVLNIIHRYENLSYKYCIDCGEPSTLFTTGWVIPICTDCAGVYKGPFVELSTKDALDKALDM